VAILAGAVIMGGLIIANAFPSEQPSSNAAPRSGASPSPSASPKPSGSPSPAGHALVCASPNGLLVAVENAADPSKTLASPAAAKLKNAGYAFAATTDVSDAASTIPKTIVFYRAPSDKHAAACMKKNFFSTAVLKPMSAGGTAANPAFSQSARLAVFLGQDYAAAQGK
jgi:LytR cell envelope-related transcriptional attenuator